MGDNYIKTVANELKQNSRALTDIVLRCGGDEFILVYVDCPLEIVEKKLEKILYNIKAKSENFSISYGISHFKKGDNLKEILSIADKRMYDMKRIHKSQNINFKRV